MNVTIGLGFAIVAVIVLAILYGIALTGDHPLLSNYLWGLGADRSNSLEVRLLGIVIGIGVLLYAVFEFDGSFGAPRGTTQWWLGVAVAIFAVVLVGGGLLRSLRQAD